MHKKIASWIIAGLLLFLPLFTAAEENSDALEKGAESGLDESVPWSIDITINGIPIEKLIGTASGMFADSAAENVCELISGMNDIFSKFAEDMTADLKGIEERLGSLTEDSWRLNIPAVSLNTVIRRSAYENALDLYRAQNGGETGREGRLAANCREGSGNSIIYIYDEANVIPALLESVENGTIEEMDVIFGVEGFTGVYEVAAVLFLAPSDDPHAICNLADLTDMAEFDVCRNYITEHATKEYDTSLEYGDGLLTIVFWNEDAAADWLTVVAKEVPFMLE